VNEVDAVLELATHLARQAGAIQRERYETAFRIRTKSASIDLVTEVDNACEALIVETLHRERPGDAILAEEGGGEDRADAEWRWVIDPLDGTMNYAHGYPRFCVSIGIERRGEGGDGAARRTELGVVYDPLLDELFSGRRGDGARIGDRELRVSEEDQIGRALLATGFAYDVHRAEDDNVDHFAHFVKVARGLRRDGSAALDLCYVAAGRLDGFWELKLHPWDVCAGSLIVEEAGGRLSDFHGRPSTGDGRRTVASNGKLHDAMIEVLRR
jgi:myo-inositol-1(or 4)-monophosphatase